jgi:hypothetical protein
MAQIASLVRNIQYDGFIVVELIAAPGVRRQHSLAHALALSRLYTQLLFGIRRGAKPVDLGPHVRLPR